MATNKSGAKKGEARRGAMSYSKGVPMSDGTILDAGRYQLRLVDMGKAGDAGWKPGQKEGWPTRGIKFEVLGTEDEATGNEVALRTTLTTNPKMFWLVHGLAQACDWDKELDFGDAGDPEQASDPQVRVYRRWIDGLLTHLLDKELVISAELKPEEWQGRTSNRVKKFLPAEEGELSQGDVEENEDEVEETNGGDDDSGDSGDTETIAAAEAEVGSKYNLPSGEIGEFLGVKSGKARFRDDEGNVIILKDTEEVVPVEGEEEPEEQENADTTPEPEPEEEKVPAKKSSNGKKPPAKKPSKK